MLYPAPERFWLRLKLHPYVTTVAHPFPELMPRLRHSTEKIVYLGAASFFLVLNSKVIVDLVWTGHSDHLDQKWPLLFPTLINLTALDFRLSNNIIFWCHTIRTSNPGKRDVSKPVQKWRGSNLSHNFPFFAYLSSPSSKNLDDPGFWGTFLGHVSTYPCDGGRLSKLLDMYTTSNSHY